MIAGTIETPYYTLAEACDYLRMTGKNPVRVLLYYIREGRLNAKRMGRTYLFTRDQLDSFLEAESSR